ncbi:3-ketoacyl-ACP reductase [Azohydromonas aeria]|uniref:3-ketoacyl-ACP reductase n=1 Tax=Azohydromonas aeria TaxID=2590212 RepID=UPI0012F8B5AF|nr:3-ketoacyl-ACP reductase [Azohydromonas aeria]
MHTPPPPRPVAIVTGGLRGIGHAIAHRLAAEGFDLALVDLDAPGNSTDDTLTSLPASGGRARYYQLDISDIQAHDGVLSYIARDFTGPLACLVNNAGIASRPLTDVLEVDAKAFDRSLAINLRGTFFLTQAFARRLLDAPAAPGLHRCIVVITSIAAELVSVERAPYCIGKSALSTVARLFAARLAAHGIQVHEVRPGFIQTDMTASAGSNVIDQWIREGRVPMPRWGTPQDVADVVAVLASGKMPYTTGQPFWVAGGLNIARAT